MSTQTDLLNCGAACAAESSAYVGNNPAVYVDPSGMRRAFAPGVNPVAQAGEESVSDWLLKRAKQIVTTGWNTSFNAKTTGFCGDLSIDFVISFEGQGCFVDDGSRLGSAEFGAAGIGSANVSLTAEVLLSNASSIKSLAGYGMCVGVGGGVGVVGSLEVCWGLTGMPQSVTDLVPSMVSSTWIINGGVGPGWESAGLPGVGAHVVFGYTAVQEIWKYDKVAWGAVKRVCGRVIANPLQAQFPPVCPFLTPWA